MTNRFDNPLPGVPLVESPFFDDAFAALELDEPVKAIAAQLHTQGWAVFDFPEPELDVVAERIKQSLHPHYDWDHWRAAGWRDNDGLRIQDAYKFNADVQRIAANPQIIALLSTLYGRRAWPFQTLNFPVGTQQHYHTDSVHFSSVPERFMCGVWVALEDVGPTQGPLMYFSRSHKWPIYTNEHIGLCRADESGPPSQLPFQAAWAELVRVNRLEPNYFHAKKGQAVIWAANLLHGGSRQTDPELTRWSQVTHYYFDGCSYYSPMTSDPFYGRIFFRRPRDIGTGAIMPNIYCGHRVRSQFIWSMTIRAVSIRQLCNELRRSIAARIAGWTSGLFAGRRRGVAR
jgi:Phytanoyl-CoA dioxygenase (PhyH)